MTKVAVALSGGVDSAVTTALLLEQGYEVVGITGQMICDDNFQIVVENAKKVADKLGIEHYVINSTKEFKQHVIDYFEQSYKDGKTPNPCTMCNKYIKWGTLFDYAINVLKVDYIATGHYADIKNVDGIFKLYPAQDEQKDQLYFLFLLNQKHLSKTLFPLSSYTKEEVKKIAEKYDLPPKSAKESQDICFIKAPMTTKKYLNNKFSPVEGNFIQKSSGKILGKHNGYWQYTIGQRKGIGLAAPEALYVLEIEPQSNTVYVGYKKELEIQELNLENVDWNYVLVENEFDAYVKIRYNMKAVKSHVTINENITNIRFLESVSGLTSGQACVLYDIKDGHLLGGAYID